MFSGCRYGEEPGGEEHEVGEHVLADLEFGSQEEAGLFIYIIYNFLFLFNLSSNVFHDRYVKLLIIALFSDI